MITVVARLKVAKGNEAAFRAAAEQMVEHVKANEPTTLTYVLHRSRNDPTEFMFHEIYTDDGALASHGTSQAMQRFLAAAGPLLDGQPDIAMYEELGGKRR